MKIITKNLKLKTMTLHTQSLDDVWLMYRIIQPSDYATAWTERKIKVGDATTEKTSAVTIKKLLLTIKVEKISYENDGKNVRLLGTINEGNEYVSAGEYHSLTIDDKTEITIKKNNWPGYVIRQLEEATLGGRGTTIVVAFDRSQAMIGSLAAKGFNKIASLSGDVQKKGIDAKVKESFYEQIVKHIVDIDKRIEATTIVLASSNFWKDPLLHQIETQAKALRKKVKWVECEDISERAIGELSKTQEFQQLTMGRSQLEMYNTFEEVLRRIATDGAATYGIKEIEKATEQSAMGTVLISQNLIKSAQEKGNFEQIETLLKLIEQNGATVHIVGDETTIVDKLDGLGGIVGLLRFKI